MSFQIRMFSIDKKEHDAIEQYKLYEETACRMDESGYHVAFSGGKDSIVIDNLAKYSNVKFTSNYNVTGIDPPEAVYNMRTYYRHVIEHPHKKSMIELIVAKGMPPTRRMRYCCEVLKEGGGDGKFVVTGVRKAESEGRKGRGQVEIVTRDKKDKIILTNDNTENRRLLENCSIRGKRVFNPIINWTDEDVWEYIRKHDLPYPCNYDEGFCRIDCIGCPLASTKNREIEFQRYPKFKNYYLTAFKLMLEKHNENGDFRGTWKTPEDVFNWWMGYTKKAPKQIEGQLSIFDL